MDKAFEYDIVIEQGATFNLSIELVDLVGTTETPTNITGWMAAMQARDTFQATTKLFDLTTENGGITVDGTRGRLNATVTGTVTGTFTPGWKGVYDLKIYMPSGEIDRIIRGCAKVSPEVTR